jgi:hypothetical protein
MVGHFSPLFQFPTNDRPDHQNRKSSALDDIGGRSNNRKGFVIKSGSPSTEILVAVSLDLFFQLFWYDAET